MFQFLRGIALIVAIILNCGTAFGQNDLSANTRMPGCRSFLSRNHQTDEEFGYGAQCAGLIEGIAFAASGICPPASATKGQAIRVVVKYIDDRPERQNEDFRALAREALRAAWPCKK